MVGTGAVIAQRLDRPVADKDRAGMMNALHQWLGIFHRQFKVLGRNAVRDARFLQAADLDQRAAIGERTLNGLPARHLRQ